MNTNDLNELAYLNSEVYTQISDGFNKDFSSFYETFREKNYCGRCGECCQNTLLLSDAEIQTINRYIKKNNIIPINHNNIFSKGYQDICPFLDKNNSCLIYEVRPEICRRFFCSKFLDNDITLDHKNKKAINMLLTFFPNAYCPNSPNIENINNYYQSIKDKLYKRSK